MTDSVHVGSATTTEAVRRAIQHSQESLSGACEGYGVNPKTVAKWKARSSAGSTADRTQPRSTVLSAEEEAVAAAFRRHTLLLLDIAFMPCSPRSRNLTRSSLHRCSQRHGIPGCRRSKAKPGQTQIQGLSDRLFSSTSPKFEPLRPSSPARRHRSDVEVRLRRDAREGGAPHRGDFLRRLMAAVLTRSIPSSPTTEPTSPHRAQYEFSSPGHQGRPRCWGTCRAHAFEYACAQNDIDHRLTKAQRSNRGPMQA